MSDHILQPTSPPHEKYIGDAVYAAFDGFSIWLRTGDANNQRICLEPAVFRGLVEFAKGIDKKYGADHFFKRTK